MYRNDDHAHKYTTITNDVRMHKHCVKHEVSTRVKHSAKYLRETKARLKSRSGSTCDENMRSHSTKAPENTSQHQIQKERYICSDNAEREDSNPLRDETAGASKATTYLPAGARSDALKKKKKTKTKNKKKN